MTIILSIESSGPLCSVALHREGVLMDSIDSSETNAHGEKLALFVQEITQKHHLKISDLIAVAISRGPGSYTGLRIGVSLAKGLCYAAGIPLLAVDTLKTLALGISQNLNDWPENTVFMPMIDARRMEVYTAGYNLGLEKVTETHPLILDDLFEQTLLTDKVYFTAGSGCFKLEKINLKQSILSFESVQLSANYIGQLAFQKFIIKEFEDLAYFEPDYLKEFAAITKKTDPPS